MPSDFTVFLVADRLLAAGERPSLRKVREAIPTGGSPREICKHLRTWRKKRGYDPKLEPTDMSKALQDKGQALAAEIWRQAKREATKAFANERATVEANAADERQDREHLLGMIEALQAANAALVDRATAAEDEAARVQDRLDRVENQLDRFRSLEFWDRVMQEIFEIIPAGGAMTPAEILPELRTWTVRGAALHKEPLTAAVLKKKMDGRVLHGRYFEPPVDGRYARRTG